MSRVIEHRKLTETLHITECIDGFWLYDKTQGMNLGMRAKTAEAAFVKALGYYQRRLAKVEADYCTLQGHVDSFVTLFQEEEEEQEED